MNGLRWIFGIEWAGLGWKQDWGLLGYIECIVVLCHKIRKNGRKLYEMPVFRLNIWLLGMIGVFVGNDLNLGRFSCEFFLKKIG